MDTQSKSNATSSNGDKSTCQICGKANHVALDCWYRFDYSYQSEDIPQALAALTLNNNDASLYADTGATAHMINDEGKLLSKMPYIGHDKIFVGDGNGLTISHIGNACVSTNTGLVKLNDVLVVPELTKNLLSVGKFASDHQCVFEFTGSGFVIKDQNKRIIIHGSRKGKLYALDGVFHEALSAIKKDSTTFSIWHQRLGHPHAKGLSFLKDKNLIDVSVWVSKPSICVSCQMGKSCKIPFNKANKISMFPLEKIHCDLWGPAPIASNQSFRYYAIFVDDFSRFTWLYPLRKKADFFDCFVKFQKLVENQLDRKIKVFQYDGGGEFNSTAFQGLLSTSGISLQVSCPYTPEQNGVAERKHRHIVETGLTIFFHANLPLHLWVESFSTAAYLINRLPSPGLNNVTPYYHIHNRNPYYGGLRVFGCQCFPSLRHHNNSKFSKKTYPCIFLGYSPLHKGYRCLEPHTKRVYISRHVVFNEEVFPYRPNPPQVSTPNFDLIQYPSTDEWFSKDSSTDSLPLETENVPAKHRGCCDTPLQSHDNDATNDDSSSAPISISSSSTDENNTASSTSTSTAPSSIDVPDDSSSTNVPSSSLPIALSKPQRDCHPPPYLKDYATVAISSKPVEPKTLKSALKDLNWVAAMKEELAALHDNHTWALVPRPLNVNVIGSKWVFRINTKEDGSIDRFKARLVARGFTQIPGVDFDNTFSPVIKPTTIRLVISLAISYNWTLKQLDVKNAFLHGVLKETIYMEQQPGFVEPEFSDHVCLLKKSLYGLKQAPRAWFDRLSQFLFHIGFNCSKADPSLFILRKSSMVIILLIYVDDILVAGNDSSYIQQLITQLGTEFAIKDLGSLHYFLGIEVKRSSDGIFLSQQKYIHDLLTRTGMLDSSPSATPEAIKTTSDVDQSTLVDAFSYRSIVGALQYLTFTRPDIAHAVNRVCQHFSSPTLANLHAAKRILRYLKGTPDFGLHYLSRSPSSLYAFSDADWAGCQVTRRSTSGFCLFLGSNCISWSSKKQPTVSRSSSEAEYRSMAFATAEITWITYLLRDFGVQLLKPPNLFCDNLSALNMTINPMFHSRSKHISLDYHFVHEKVVVHQLVTRYIPSVSQPANIFTKPLAKAAFHTFRRNLHVQPPSHARLRGNVKEFVITNATESITTDSQEVVGKLSR